MSAGAVAVLRARKLKPSSEKLYPDAAVIVKATASPAAAWVVGLEKNPPAPLICAALSQPVLEVKELKVEPLLIVEIVMPEMEDAELENDSSVKSKFANVAAWVDE